MLGKSTPPGSDYYPSKLDQTTVGTSTQHTFLVFSKDDKHGAPHTSILNAFLRHKVRINSQVGYADAKLGGYVSCLSCDLKNADISADGLTVELRMLKSVSTASSVRMENRIFEGVFFPLTLLDKRVIALSSGITFLLEERLKTREEKNALVEVGRVYAISVVAQIQKLFPPSTSKKILQDNISDYFKACGLGRFNFVASQEKAVQMAILDPPLSETGQAAGNHFLQGVVEGLLEAIDNRSMTVMEDLYDARARRLSFHLVEKSIAEKSSAPLLKPSMPKEIQSQALDEVEKVIKSLENTGPDLDDKSPLVIEVSAERSEGIAARENAKPAFYTERGPSLNGALKTYKDEGWIGGKIGTTPENGEAAHLVVIKYPESSDKSPTESKPTMEKEKTVLVEKIEKEETTSEGSDLKITQQSPRKTRNDEEENEAYNEALRDSDALYFEDSI
jgi:hypothetical protein